MTQDTQGGERPAKVGPYKVKFTPPSYALKAKSPPTGQPLNEALAAADAVVADLAEDYPARARARIADLQQTFEAMQNHDEAHRALESMFAIALDIRGQSGTFGFPLATEIAASLCAMLEASGHAGGPPQEAIRVHIAALNFVMTNAIKGDGGAQGAELQRGLEKVSSAEALTP